MANVLFLSEDYLKSFSIINDNTDMKVITPLIEKIQDQRIQTAIGSGLYNQLKTQITAGTVTSLNETLLDDYIIKAMIWWVMYEAPMVFVFRFMNKGVMVKNSDNSTPANLAEIDRLRDGFKNDAEWYTNRIVKYLQENANSYPLYDNPGDGVDTITPQGYSYSGGMNLEPEPGRKKMKIDYGRLNNC